MRINQNIAAFNAYRNLNQTQGQLSSSLEKLSSGFRINRAADDAAGLVNSENLRSQTGGLKVATRNAQDAISMVQTAEGAQTEVHSILQRMRDLAVQSGNLGTNDDAALQANQDELDELVAELDRIADQTQFGTLQILNGDLAGSEAVAGTTQDISDAVVTENNPDGGATAGDDATQLTINTADGAWTGVETEEGDLELSFDLVGADELDVVVEPGASAEDVESAINGALTDAGLGGDYNVTVAGDDVTIASDANSDETMTVAAETTGIDAEAGASFQVGANAGQTIDLNISGVSAAALEVNDLVIGGGAEDAETIEAAIETIDDAISTVSSNRAELGAFQNRAESTIRNLSVAVENLSAAESRIRDTDMAAEMVEFTRGQILQQAGTAMLAQANQVPQSVLALLQ